MALIFVGGGLLVPATGEQTSAAPGAQSLPVVVVAPPGTRLLDLVPTVPPVPTVVVPALPLPTATLPALALVLPTATVPVVPLPRPTVPMAPLPTLAQPLATVPTLVLPTATIPAVPLPRPTVAAVPVPTAPLPALPRPTTLATLLAHPTSTPSGRSAVALPPTSIPRGGAGHSSGPLSTATPSGAGNAPARGNTTPTPPPVARASSGAAPPQGSTSTPPPDGANAPRPSRTPPSITLSPPSARPGVRVSVAGRNFGPGELITLALDGEALLTRPATIVSSRRGRFAATFITPHALLAGENTIAASGATTGRSAVAPLKGVPGVASHFYFAGGENSATVHAFLALLNSDERPARVHLTFFGRRGVTDTRAVTIAPTRERTLSVSDLGVHRGFFGLAVRADSAIAATLTLSRAHRDGDLLLGSPDLATRWYLAEGYTSLTFHETVAILNPGGTVARVILRLLPTDGRHVRSVALRVAPYSEAIANVNHLLRHQALSVVVDSNRPVIVARPLTFSFDRAGSGFGLTLRTGSTTPATSWLFAEGSTLDRFQTFLTVLNPNRTSARITARFYGNSGQTLGRRTLSVAAGHRGTIKLNRFLKANGIASVVTSDRPVVVERAEYFGSPNDPYIAGSAVYGRNGPAMRWSFPGGAATGGTAASEYLQLYNPSARTVSIEATFFRGNGEMQRFHLTVSPHVHYTIIVRRVSPHVAPEHGVTLQSTNGQGFVAEQTLFTPDHRVLLGTQGFAQ